jgi:enediyne biosynthesis protein E4
LIQRVPIVRLEAQTDGIALEIAEPLDGEHFSRPIDLAAVRCAYLDLPRCAGVLFLSGPGAARAEKMPVAALERLEATIRTSGLRALDWLSSNFGLPDSCHFRRRTNLLPCWASILLVVLAHGCGKDAEQVVPKSLAPRTKLANQSAVQTAGSDSEPSAEPIALPSEELIAAPLSAIPPRPASSPMFEMLAPERTGVDFQMQVPDVAKNVREVIHLNVNGGICTGDYDGDGLTDFYVTSPKGGNRLFRNLGDFRFQDVTADMGLEDENFWGTGATFVDIDDDGDLDIYACGYRHANRLYINERRKGGSKLQFTEQSDRFGLGFDGASMTMAFADIENDGDLDGYLATTAKAPPEGLNEKFRYAGNRLVVVDEAQEYWQLIYTPDGRALPTEAGQFDHLYRNDGKKFTEITKSAGIKGPQFTLSATWWDYNDDGFPDLYAANDFMGPDYLYHNNGDGTFTEVAKNILPHTPWFSMGTDIADVNNDGRIDFLATDMDARTHHRKMVMRGNIAETNWFLEIGEPRQYVRSALYINSGAGRMIEAGYQTKLASTDWTWNPRLADFDNDGRADLYVTNGIVRDMMNADLTDHADSNFTPGSAEWAQFWAEQSMRPEPNVALRNLGDLRFEDVSAAWGLDRNGVSFGAATADFDNDGDLDLVVSNADAPVSVYRNGCDTGHRARIRLHGRASNRFGIGAKIDLVAAGLRQTSYLTLARGWLSASEPIATFGLGDARVIDALTVTWPSGHQQRFTDLAADHFYTITEPAADPPAKPRARRPASAEPQPDSSPMFVPAAGFPRIDYQDEPFNDMSLQPLLPYRLSEISLAMAWADVDEDGDDDCYVGGPKGQAGRLLLNSGDGAFQQQQVADLEADRECEDTDAEFFDTDGDGDLDLYVVSGSIEHPPGDAAYQDRLYLNQGSGQFQKSSDGALPDLRDSGSVAAACDFDKDGDVDLFVGSRSLPRQYPLPPVSRLLVNAGGRFEEKTPHEIERAGMVTDAVWADVDGNSWPDLLVTTDWGPIRVFSNEDGKLSEKTGESGLADRLGWWLAIASGDFDGDGDVDFVATNFGLNTRYKASPKQPARLYYGDFEASGESHLVEALYEGQAWYPRRDLDALRNAMPALMSKYKSFDVFGRATLADIFAQERLDRAKLFEANTLESGVLINEGQFRFRFEPLPALAQVAPSFGVDVGDVNLDGHPDIVMAQNFYSPHLETGRMDGGVSLLLSGDGQGKFQAVWPDRSGVVVPADARRVRVVELDGDGRPDLVVAVHNGECRAFLNRVSTSESQNPLPLGGRAGEGDSRIAPFHNSDSARMKEAE